jgi:hypothetical protein
MPLADSMRVMRKHRLDPMSSDLGKIGIVDFCSRRWGT